MVIWLYGYLYQCKIKNYQIILNQKFDLTRCETDAKEGIMEAEDAVVKDEEESISCAFDPDDERFKGVGKCYKLSYSNTFSICLFDQHENSSEYR